MLARTAWHGDGLASLGAVRVPIGPGQRLHFTFNIEDLDFVALRFGGHQGLVDAIARAIGRIRPPVDGTAGVQLTIAGRLALMVALRGQETDALPAMVASALRGFLGAAKLTWEMQVS